MCCLNKFLLTRKLIIAPVRDIQLGKEMNELSCKRLIDWSAVAANSALQSQVKPCIIAPEPCIWASYKVQAFVTFCLRNCYRGN